MTFDEKYRPSFPALFNATVRDACEKCTDRRDAEQSLLTSKPSVCNDFLKVQ